MEARSVIPERAAVQVRERAAALAVVMVRLTRIQAVG